MTLVKKSHKPAGAHKVSRPTHTAHTTHATHTHTHAHEVISEGDAAKKLLLSMVEKPHLEKNSPTEDIVSEEVPLETASEISVSVPEKLTEPVVPSTPAPTPLGDNFDSRKQFFQMMSQQIGQEKPPISTGTPMSGATKILEIDELDRLAEGPEENVVVNRSVNTYRKLAFRFIALALVLVVVVLYFVLVKLTVVVSPSKQTVNESLIVDVYGSSQTIASDRSLKGNITRIEAEESGIYKATGEEAQGGEITGKVKIINNYGKSQPLVATTRLLSADNKLFRIKNTVTVPAGGSVEVDVYPDVSSADMAIAPTKFTIPGLWSGLQDKIYGESSVAFAYSSVSEKYITQEDINKASQELNELLVKKVKEKVGAKNGYDQVVYQTSVETAQVELVDAKIGDKKDQFTVKTKNIVNVISFSSDDVVKIAQQKLAAASGDKTLAEIDRANLQYQLESYNVQGNLATLKVNFVSRIASANSEFIDKGKLVNLNQAQIEEYLKGVKEIEGFELNFFPTFLKRSPALVDRIYVEVK
ncbi:MAG: hypothetical protein WCJ57_00860 [Candidatus Falkowbacteria bacterium]